ncbi:MAG: hypothetical protein IT514_07940 [Burkholderiales bacterium]|nr:hypothetical protein [Burkholderiales bacterium]
MPNVLQLMQKTGLNRNQISKISGISNTLLAKIERVERSGQRIQLRRKTLIHIAVSLNMKLAEIDALLAAYGHDEVSTSDTLHFLAASESQTITGFLPLFSSLALEWFLIGMEKQLACADNALLVYTLDQPSHTLESPEHTHFLNELRAPRSKTSSVYMDMMASACAHRRKLVNEALRRGNRISTYICSGCLERYLRRWERHARAEHAQRHRFFLREHVQTLIAYLEAYPEQYRLHLLRKCPQLRYDLLYLPAAGERIDAGQKLSKLLFLGRESECVKSAGIASDERDQVFDQGFGDHIGFATDVQSMLDFFHMQHAGLDAGFVDRRFDTARAMIAHLRELLSRTVPATGD